MRGDLGPTPFTRGVAEGSPRGLRGWKRVPVPAERPVQSILTFSCVLYRGGPARELPCGSGWGRWQNTLHSGLNAEFSLATSKEHPLPTPGPS